METTNFLNNFISKKPNWILRWGSTLFFLFFVLLFIGCYFIKYNEVVSGSIIITSKNPLNHIVAQNNGRLDTILVKKDSYVNKDDLLAIVENPANYKDVLKVKSLINRFEVNIEDFNIIEKSLPSSLKLGEVQPIYNNFRLAYQSYLNHLSFNINEKRGENLALRIAAKQKIINNYDSRLKFKRKEIINNQNIFDKKEALYKKGIISELDFLEAQNILYSQKRDIKAIETLINNESEDLFRLKSLLYNSKSGEKSEHLITYQTLLEAKQLLMNSITEWEYKYLLKSKIRGKISFFDNWGKYNNIDKGERIFTIIPIEIKGIVGKINFPIANSGKVKVGQKVIIKLDNYLYREWGSITGTVQTISNVPNEEKNFYTAFIDITNLKTSFNKEIDFKQEMSGKGEIITNELSILQKVIFPLREIFEN